LNTLRQKNQEDIYKLNIKKSENARLPNVNGNFNANANWGRGIDPYTNTYANHQFNTYNGGLSFDLNLFNGFYNINNIKLQKQDLETNKSQWQKIKNDLTIDIAMRYTNILYLQDMIKNIKEQLKSSKDNIDFTQKKIDGGVLAKREIYKAIAQKDNEELNLITAENNYEINLLELKQLMNMDVNKPIFLKDISTKNSSKIDKSEFLAKAIDNAPSLKLQYSNLKKSEISLQMAKSGYYPTISFGGQLGSTYSTVNKLFTFREQLDNNFSYGLNLIARIPIFNQFSTRNKISEAKYNIIASHNQIEIEKQNLYKTLNKAYLDLVASKKKYEVSQSSLRSNQINYDTEKIKYEAGRITIQELNITKSNLFSSISNSIKDKYELIFNGMVYKIYEGEKIVE